MKVDIAGNSGIIRFSFWPDYAGKSMYIEF